MTLLADPPAAPPVAPAGQYRHGLSLLHGWLPATIYAVAAALLLLAIGWRSRRWRTLWLPLAVCVGVVAASWAHWYVDSQGMADDPAPSALWIWIGLTGLAAAVAVLGWHSARWWRRGVSLLAVPLCLLSAGLALNLWVGYFPTVQTAWSQVTAGPLPDESDQTTVAAMQLQRTVPSHGVVVPVTIPDNASHFKHRTELVYLPPAWFKTDPPPKLPVVVMIAGEFNTPGDWLRTGSAARTIDDFAHAHGGNAPVFVFADVGGSFNNDTECVNGPRGNVADHLTKDIVPFMISNYGVSAGGANWGIVGWSMGGTCAVDLTVMHPELFSTFVDIAGDLGPTAGTKEQTIARLYGGNAAAWARSIPPP
jgi:S-formylglutathione hydrolase FrmB